MTTKTLARKKLPRKGEPPRQRILAAAEELFLRQGIRGTGVEAIAEAAGTNKMALYRHFGSKDELVAQWMRARTAECYELWDELAGQHPGDARAQLIAWIKQLAENIAEADERGCPFANTLAEIPEKGHPARHVIEAHKQRQRKRFVRLCNEAGIPDAEFVADELFFLLEGALSSAPSIGYKTVGKRLILMAEQLIGAEIPTKRTVGRIAAVSGSPKQR
ncbi:MAG: helix-turn-helix domain-containing protein [Tepidisphaeraceae bacterium]|jgi:AcrR family transcriptional regulator